MKLTDTRRPARRLVLAFGLVELLRAALMSSVASADTQPCAGLQIIYARGTSEPANPYGAILGNTLVADLQQDVPGTSAYEVNYPATTTEPSSEEAGNTDLVSHITAQAAACPNEKFVLAGYSQGANVVADSVGVDTSAAVVGGPSVAQIPASLAPKVVALLQFGPPYNQIGESIPSPYSAVTDQFCTSGDLYCSTNPDPTNGLHIHLTSYQAHLSSAAAYAANNMKAGIGA
jgi:cutinase